MIGTELLNLMYGNPLGQVGPAVNPAPNPSPLAPPAAGGHPPAPAGLEPPRLEARQRPPQGLLRPLLQTRRPIYRPPPLLNRRRISRSCICSSSSATGARMRSITAWR